MKTISFLAGAAVILAVPYAFRAVLRFWWRHEPTPETPVGWAPKLRTWRNGVEVFTGESGREDEPR